MNAGLATTPTALNRTLRGDSPKPLSTRPDVPFRDGREDGESLSPM
jgi:hypothetical protein